MVYNLTWIPGKILEDFKVVNSSGGQSNLELKAISQEEWTELETQCWNQYITY